MNSVSNIKFANYTHKLGEIAKSHGRFRAIDANQIGLEVPQTGLLNFIKSSIKSCLHKTGIMFKEERLNYKKLEGALDNFYSRAITVLTTPGALTGPQLAQIKEDVLCVMNRVKRIKVYLFPANVIEKQTILEIKIGSPSALLIRNQTFASTVKKKETEVAKGIKEVFSKEVLLAKQFDDFIQEINKPGKGRIGESPVHLRLVIEELLNQENRLFSKSLKDKTEYNDSNPSIGRFKQNQQMRIQTLIMHYVLSFSSVNKPRDNSEAIELLSTLEKDCPEVQYLQASLVDVMNVPKKSNAKEHKLALANLQRLRNESPVIQYYVKNVSGDQNLYLEAQGRFKGNIKTIMHQLSLSDDWAKQARAQPQSILNEGVCQFQETLNKLFT
ncbi:MAG: hypothetical protein H0W88_07980 [Parachlamydiaceae bacterium]|nr:hypothetical protein [Parachlamydiaceae bacterium]